MGELLAVGSFLLYALIGGVACAVAGFFILDRVDRGLSGTLLGLFLGPIGLVIAWVMRDNAIRDEAERRERHARAPDGDRPRAGIARSAQAWMRPGSAAPPASVIEELERLAALKEKGHLTDEEFNARKRKLLDMESSGASQHVSPGHPIRQPRRFR